jgi:hypothetical protein
MDKSDPIYQNLQRFANEHKLILEDNAEVGFCRPCVGFNSGRAYVDYNPYRYVDKEGSHFSELEQIEALYDPRLAPPKSTPDAYHKHGCMAVLVHGDNYDEALRQLNEWVKHLEAQGRLVVVEYRNGATGSQAAFSGSIGRAIAFQDQLEKNPLIDSMFWIRA